MSKYKLPIAISTVSAGFPNPAEEFVENKLDIFERVIKNPSSTFLVRARGNSMIGDSIQDGDILVVDKSITPRSNTIVIAYIDGEFTVKRYVKNNNSITLYPANTQYNPIDINEYTDFLIWGVVTYVIHECI